MESTILLYTIISAVIALGFAGLLCLQVLSLPEGNKKMTDIALAIKTGANAYLVRQYKVVALVAIMWLSPSDRTLLVAVATPIFFLMGFVFLLPVK